MCLVIELTLRIYKFPLPLRQINHIPYQWLPFDNSALLLKVPAWCQAVCDRPFVDRRAVGRIASLFSGVLARTGARPQQPQWVRTEGWELWGRRVRPRGSTQNEKEKARAILFYFIFFGTWKLSRYVNQKRMISVAALDGLRVLLQYCSEMAAIFSFRLSSAPIRFSAKNRPAHFAPETTRQLG